MASRSDLGMMQKVNRRKFIKLGGGGVFALGACSSATPLSFGQVVTHNGNSSQNASRSDDGIVYHDGPESDPQQGFPHKAGDRVSIENWHEHYRWLHLNTDLIFKSHTCELNNSHQPAILPRQIIPKSDLLNASVKWQRQEGGPSESITVRNWFRRAEADAFIVSHRGKIVAEHYFGDMRPDRRHLLWSTSKSVLSSIFYGLINNEVVKGDDPIVKFDDNFKNGGLDGATIQQMFDMQTGVDFRAFQSSKVLEQLAPEKRQEWSFGSPEMRHASHNFAKSWRAQGLGPKLPTESHDTGVYDLMFELKKDHPHGSYFYYAEPNVWATQYVLEKVTNRSYMSHITAMATDAGFEHSPRIWLDPIGTPNGNIGLQLTARDWIRWAHWVMRNKRLVEDILSNPGVDKWTDESNFSGRWPGGSGYRNFFYTTPQGKRRTPMFYAYGWCHQQIMLDPRREIVIAKFCSQPDVTEVDKDLGATQSFADTALPRLLGIE